MSCRKGEPAFDIPTFIRDRNVVASVSAFNPDIPTQED
jgi:hypothetical protein